MGSEIVLSLQALEELKGSQAGEVVVVPGSLNTTLDKSAIAPDELSELLNCDVDAGVFKIDERRRQFQKEFSTGNAQGLGYGQFGTCEEIVALHASAMAQINASEVDNDDGTTASAWVNLTPPSSIDPTETFVVWQYRRWLFMASQSTFMQKEICDTLVRTVGKTLPNPGNATWAFNPPPYETERFVAGDLAPPTEVTSDAGAADTIGPLTVDAGGNLVIRYTWHQSTTPQVKLKIKLDFATAKVWTDRGFIGFQIVLTNGLRIGGVNGNPLSHIYFYQTGAVGSGFEKIPRSKSLRAGPQFNVLLVWCDMTKMPSALMAAVEQFELEFYLLPVRGSGDIIVAPIVLGGSYLGQLGADETIDGDQTVPAPKVGPHTEDIEYGFRFKHDATVFSDLFSFKVPGTDALGNPLWPAFGVSQVYLGAWVDVKIPQNLTGGFIATDTIELYRKVNGEWYLIASGLNGSGGLSFTDKKTGYYIAGNITPTPGLNLGGIDPANLTGITFGCEWKGSNVIFRTDGLGYFSRSNTATDWLWSGPLVPGTVTGRIDDPVTLYISGNQGLPIISAVPLGPLYMFSRKKGYVMFGDLPSEASFPISFSPLRGALGPFASCPHYNGAVFASDDGLWYVQVDESLIGDRREPEMIELTKDIRPTWQAFIGSTETSRAKTIVRARGGEIWCFCEDRILHRTKNHRWIPGVWTDGKHVKAAVVDPFRGLVLLMLDGTLCQIGKFTTDGGTDKNGSNGAIVRCSAAGPQYLSSARALSARGVYEWPDDGTKPDFTVTVESELVPAGAQAVLDRLGTSDWTPFKSLETVGVQRKPIAGRHFRVKIEFSGVGVLKKLWLKLAPYPQGRGDPK